MIDLFFLLLIVLIFDIIWLTLTKKGYMCLVKNVQGKPLVVKILPAILSYICVFMGIVIFSIPMIQSKMKAKNNTNDLLKYCIMFGGGLGLVVYGVFNFTNMAIFKDYDIIMALKDTAWGITLFTIATFLYFTLLKPRT